MLLNGDFGSQLDASLQQRIAALLAAADEARARIDRAVAAQPPATSAAGTAPMPDAPVPPRAGAAVSFDREEPLPAAVDSEGIPVPEENL